MSGILDYEHNNFFLLETRDQEPRPIASIALGARLKHRESCEDNEVEGKPQIIHNIA